MKKYFILITSLLILFIMIPSVYADTTYFDSDYTFAFSGDTSKTVSTVNVSGSGEMGDGWYITNGVNNWWTVTSPEVLLPSGTTLQEVKIPNYVIYRNGSYETSTIESVQVQLYKDGPYGKSKVGELNLSNWGPGGKSYFRLLTPQTFTEDRYIKIQIKATTSIVQRMSIYHENPHPLVNMYSTYGVANVPNNATFWTGSGKIEAAFFESIKRSFSPTWINAQSWITESNYYSSVIFRTSIEFEPPVDPGDFNELSELPDTRGTLFTNKLDMGRVFMTVDGLNVIAKVEYDVNADKSITEDEMWYLPFTMAPDTDMTIFNHNYETFYYTYEGERYFVINHGNQSMFLYNDNKNYAFIPYTVWNLDTGEIKSVSKLNVFMYAVVENMNQLYSYFYADEFLIDNLLSVMVSFEYRYRYWVEIGGPEAWKHEAKLLEHNKMSWSAAPWWIAFLSGGIPGMVANEVLVGTKMPTLWVGSLANSMIGLAGLSWGYVDEIQEFNPSTQFRQELNNRYAEVGLVGELSPDTKIFKLFLGTFNNTWAKGIEINKEFNAVGNQKGINIIELTYETQGQIHTVSGENINVVIVYDDNTQTDPGIVIPEIDFIMVICILVGVAIAAIIIVASATNGVFFNRRGFNFGAFVSVLIGALFAGAILGIIAYLVLVFGFGNSINVG